MSLPTAHNYVVKTMMENLVSLEKNFLEPKLLIETLIETDKALTESIEVFGNKNFSKGERDNIEMKLCFGNKKEPEFFLGNNNFDKLSFRLYGPLIQALKK